MENKSGKLIKSMIRVNNYIYYKVNVYYKQNTFIFKAVSVQNKKLFKGQAEDNLQSFQYLQEYESKICYLWERSSINPFNQEIQFNLTEQKFQNQQKSNLKLQEEPRTIQMDLTVVYHNNQRQISTNQNEIPINQTSNELMVPKNIIQSQTRQISNKDQQQITKKIENKKDQSKQNQVQEQYIQIDVDLKSIQTNYVQNSSFDFIEENDMNEENEISENQIQNITQKIMNSVKFYNDGSIILDCQDSINSQGIKINKVLKQNNLESDNQNAAQNKNSNIYTNMHPVVPCIQKVLKKGYLYSESKQRHTIFIKEWVEDQNNLLRITDQVYYECQKYYTIEAFNQNFQNSIYWKLNYIQLETLLFGKKINTTFEKAIHDFLKSFLIYQKVLIIEVDDDRDLHILNNRPHCILLLNKKHVRAFQKNARTLFMLKKINKARMEWNSIKLNTIAQFVYRYRGNDQGANLNPLNSEEEIITQQQIINDLNSQLKNDEENIQYFKFVIYEKAVEQYFVKCWDLSNFKSIEKQLSIKNLKKLSNTLDISNVVSKYTTIDIHNVSVQMADYFNMQSQNGNKIIQFYLGQFFIQIDQIEMNIYFKQILKRSKAN